MNGHFELNVYVPLMARNLLQSIGLLASASRLLAEKCVDGIEANRERNESYAESTLSAATALNPYIGYDKASEIVKDRRLVRALAARGRARGRRRGGRARRGARLPRDGQAARLSARAAAAAARTSAGRSRRRQQPERPRAPRRAPRSRRRRRNERPEAQAGRSPGTRRGRRSVRLDEPGAGRQGHDAPRWKPCPWITTGVRSTSGASARPARCDGRADPDSSRSASASTSRASRIAERVCHLRDGFTGRSARRQRGFTGRSG